MSTQESTRAADPRSADSTCHASTDSSGSSTVAVTPPNFSWCEDGRLAACAFPGQREHLKYLVDHNVTCLVSLTAEREVEPTEPTLQIIRLPVTDYTPPTMEQVEDFVKTVVDTNDNGKAVCVHCAHGLGRTGTMLACYYVKVAKMAPQQAIEHVRKLRPGSVETAEQEVLIHKFAEFCHKEG